VNLDSPIVDNASFPKTLELLGRDLPKKHPLLNPRYSTERRRRFELLASNLLQHFAVGSQRERLVTKLLNPPQFETALGEVETWSYFHNQGFRVDVEPFGEKGPDFRVSKDGLATILEVCSLGREAAELHLSAIFTDIARRTADLRSCYRMDISFRERECQDSRFVLRAVRATKQALASLEKSGSDSALFCYFTNGDHVFLDGIAGPEEIAASGSVSQLRSSEDICTSAFVVGFRKFSTAPKHLITVSSKDGALWSKSVERLKSNLNEKRGKQLRRGDRNIIVVDRAGCIDLDGTDVLDALYGRAYVRVDVETLTECGQGRRRDGFFKNTRRVQAVALIGSADLSGSCQWTIFPSHNPSASGRFTLEEFELLGGLPSDLRHLAL
jgi:hypothetical protein